MMQTKENMEERKIKEYKREEREIKECKREGLDGIARRCEQIANNYFSLEDKEWNLLLLFRDKLDKLIEKKYK